MLGLKEFGLKHVLWEIDSFTRFMQGKLISDKKVETIIDAINITWNMNVSFFSIGFFADDRGDLANNKLDELTRKLGFTVRFGPVYSPWSNGLNKRNHTSPDVTIRKMMEDKKTSLLDALVKTAATTYNTSINKLDF